MRRLFTSNIVVQLHGVHLVNALDLVQTSHVGKAATLYGDAGLVAVHLQTLRIQARGRRESSDQLRRLKGISSFWNIDPSPMRVVLNAKFRRLLQHRC